MVWTPNKATQLGRHRKRLALERSVELRQIHVLIAQYLDRLIFEPVPLIGSGLTEYFGPDELTCPQDVFQRFKNVKVHDISPRNLARAVQFAIINGLNFPKGEAFDAMFRSQAFALIKAGAIVEAGHHLHARMQGVFEAKVSNRTTSKVKQEAMDRFAYRWLAFAQSPEVLVLDSHDIETLNEMFDAVVSQTRIGYGLDFQARLKPALSSERSGVPQNIQR